ncbi:hypothetical protein EXT49_10845 [Pectobacterium polaris]|uniref:hypothetical protein n=1 Tax=Pectobacterium polaris TaxID=2042057 RepID=UPI002031673E|nr:hypothetical protein [Pectobacterium polaris]MCL6360522.1 hypothetical protein [Pectobacterium polaris]
MVRFAGILTLSSGFIGRILDRAETANAATNKFSLKGRSSFNSRATKIEEIREKIEIKKFIIQSKKNQKIINEKIKKNPANLSEDENRFKSKLKERVKIEILKSS